MSDTSLPVYPRATPFVIHMTSAKKERSMAYITGDGKLAQAYLLKA
jgi:hypothetical protein